MIILVIGGQGDIENAKSPVWIGLNKETKHHFHPTLLTLNYLLELVKSKSNRRIIAN